MNYKNFEHSVIKHSIYNYQICCQNTFGINEKCFIFASQTLEAKKKLIQGALAHLARALDWQSKGDEFESRMLHMYRCCAHSTDVARNVSTVLH